MAQVKKFNTGGSVQKMKYGNIIKNGTTYEMTEESMKRLEQYIAAADPDIQQSLANDWKLLMSGQDITIDTMANRRSTVPEDFTKGQLRRLGKDKATESKWHGAVNSDIHKYNLATQYLGKFDPSKSDKIEETPQKDFWKSNKSIEYDIEDDGTKKYRGLSNTDEKNYYDNITAYLMGDDTFRAQYKDPGISNFETLDSWFKSLPNPEEFVKNLWNKIENGQELNSDESQFWTAIGMKFGDPKANPKYEEKVKSDEAQAAKEKAWRAFNVGNVWNDSEMDSDYFTYNPTTGAFTVKMPKLEGSTGYHFNDDFIANNYGYDHLKGMISFNGKWYKEEDLYNPESELYRMLTHKQYDYRNKNLRGDFNAANQVLKTNWSGVTYIPASSDYLGPFYGQNSSYIYQDTNWLTDNSKYGALDLGGKDWNLLKAINMNGSANDLGVRDWRYILTDAYGRYIDPYGNVVETPYEFDNSKFSNLYVGQTDPSKQTVNRYTRLIDDPTSPYYNTYADEIQYQADGKTPAFEGWLDISGNNTYMYIDPMYGGIKNTVFKNMPKNIYNRLYNKAFWENNYNNADQNTKYLFSELINGNKLSERQLGKINWESLGINDELKKAFIDYFLNNRQTMQRPEAFKEGGVIKYQNPSGSIGERKVDDKVIVLAEQMSSPYESADPFSGEGLTQTDRWELASLILDGLGGIASWVPVYGDAANVLLSTIGATGTGIVADRKRVKQGALPKWTAATNALRNVGADVASFIPVAGDSANWLKFVKRVGAGLRNILQGVNYASIFLDSPGIVRSLDTFIHNPEEATIEDFRRLSRGLQMLSGVGRQAYNARRLSKIAAESVPTKDRRYSFEKTNNDGEKVTQYLDEDDVKALTNAKGQDEIDKIIDQIGVKYGLSDSERASLKIGGPSKLGFVHKKYPIIKNAVKEAPIQKENVRYYRLHPNKRVEALASRSAEDLAKTVTSTKRTNQGIRAATQFEINKNQSEKPYELPDGYVIDNGKHWWQRPSIVKLPEPVQSNKQGGILKASDGLELNPAVVVAERPKNPSTRFYSLTTKPSLPTLPERKLYLEPKSSDFAEYKAINSKEPDEVKNAREYISKLVDSEDYKKLSLTNPEIARTILSTQIEDVLANTKDENVRNQISKELESFRQTSLFKKGGVLKAQGGLPDIEIETPYAKKLKQLYDIKLNPNGMITGSAPTGIGIDKPTDPTKSETSSLPMETDIIEFPSMFKELDNDYHVDLMGTKRQAKQHAENFAKNHPGFDHFWWKGKKYGLNDKSDEWGQNPSEPLEPWVVPTATSALMSTARLGFDRKTNDIITAQKAKGIQEAANASMLSKQEFIPQRMQLTAGDASKAAANRMFQHLPPVNADYTRYAAQQRAGFDAANAMLAQSDREYSAQYSENLDKNIARQQVIADRNMQIEAQNRQIQAQKMAALSELYASRDAANRQSIANYGIEQQTKYEQGMQKTREAHLAREKSKWTIDAQKMYVNDLTKDIDVKSAYDAYLATNPTTPLSIENWVAGKPQFRNKVNEYMQKATQWIADQQLETELQYLPPIYKSGGKMRSASDQIAINREKANDQIKVNKYKSFDKNWEDQNKAVRKAIGKMHDRVYNILMKILS